MRLCSTPRPQAISSHALVVRNIPVLQVDWNISSDGKFKSSIYYDNTYLRDEDFSDSLFTQERVQQVGIENATICFRLEIRAKPCVKSNRFPVCEQCSFYSRRMKRLRVFKSQDYLF